MFGGTDPAAWGPPEGDRHRVLAHAVACRPCDYRVCPVGYPCLEGVAVREAVETAEGVLRQGGETYSRWTRARRSATWVATSAKARSRRAARSYSTRAKRS